MDLLVFACLQESSSSFVRHSEHQKKNKNKKTNRKRQCTIFIPLPVAVSTTVLANVVAIRWPCCLASSNFICPNQSKRTGVLVLRGRARYKPIRWQRRSSSIDMSVPKHCRATCEEDLAGSLPHRDCVVPLTFNCTITTPTRTRRHSSRHDDKIQFCWQTI